MKKELEKGFKLFLQDGNSDHIMKVIKKEIKDKGYSLRSLSIKISMNRNALLDILNTHRNPKIKTLRKILNGLYFTLEL